ncbi:Rha family transcriptional regulator [Halomonas sp. 18H]|nr:Rha family transcriptional regulator [Halomonas sp. 18H]MCW4151540.1 Rha family transcriptional regulator [Halomonas sp. 18H]
MVRQILRESGNIETTTTTEMTMSSREIAEVVEKRHDNVKVTIQALEDKRLVTFTASQEKSTGGRPGIVYRVNKRDSYVIVAQLSPEFTARLVDRWQELEKQVSQPQVPQSFAEALRLAADTQEHLEQVVQSNFLRLRRFGQLEIDSAEFSAQYKDPTGLRGGTSNNYNHLDPSQKRKSNRTTLGMRPGKPMVRHLSNDEKCLLRRTQLGLKAGRDMVLISESGLYKLVMRSDKLAIRLLTVASGR